MNSCSYGMRNLVLLICFKSSIVLRIGPYSCLLFKICVQFGNPVYYLRYIGFRIKLLK
jgi:hypothetical protein